jgi:hypothetical protein
VLNTERSGNDPGTTPPVANLTAEPTGRITGTAGGSLYTQSGSGITNQILDNPLADGAVAGADTDWLPAELGGLGQLPDGTPLHIGCHSDRFRLNP